MTQYANKRAISIATLVGTMWLTRYPRPMKITYGQGSEFIGHDFIESPIEKYYGITFKPITLVNITSNAILERIYQVLENLVRIFTLAKTMLTKMTHGRTF